MGEVSTCTKDSHIKWIGNIPEHWSVHTLYQLVDQVKNKNYGVQENNLLSLSYGKIKRKDINSNNGLLPASFDGYNIIEAGDIVLRLTDLQNDHTSLRVGISGEKGIITSAYITLRSNKIVNSKYIYYLLHAFDLKKGFYGMGSGVRQGLNYDEVKALRVVIPPRKEQEVIVDYLDDQCAKIENIIFETKSSIEEYKKWRESIVFECVTRGIIPETEMKEAKLPWVSEYPKNWGKYPIKRVILSREGGAWGNEEMNDINDRICMRIADFSFDAGRFKRYDEGKYTKRNYSTKQIENLTLSPGDILIEKSGGGEKTPVGRAVVYDLPFKALYANFMERIVVNRDIVYPEYFEYFWRAMYYRAVTTAYIKQTTGIQNLNLSMLLEKEYILLPDLKEQENIIRYLDDLNMKIESIINKKEIMLQEMETYKKSLIYEVVTGKRKVV
jgi:type I restriction enzyme S subunit